MAAASFSPEIMAKIKAVTAKSYEEQGMCVIHLLHLWIWPPYEYWDHVFSQLIGFFIILWVFIAIFYLNAFWKDTKPASEEAEDVWKLAEAFAKEDHVKGKNGNELNPIQAFHVLQARNQTLTALELKAQLRKVDIDANGEMALAEYLLFINNRDPIEFITNPQGSIDPVLLKQLETKLAALDAQFQQLQVQLEEQKVAATKAKEAESTAVSQEAAAKQGMLPTNPLTISTPIEPDVLCFWLSTGYILMIIAHSIQMNTISTPHDHHVFLNCISYPPKQDSSSCVDNSIVLQSINPHPFSSFYGIMSSS